ncbi:hypothetical protein D3C71_1290830 [compost metagenome]
MARHDGQARVPVRSLVPALEPRVGAEDARRPRGRVRPPQPHARAVRGHRCDGARVGDRAEDAHVDVDGPAPALRHGHALPAPEVSVRAVLGEEGRPHRRALRPGARHALHAGQRQRHEQQAALGSGRDAHRAHEGRGERHRRAVPSRGRPRRRRHHPEPGAHVQAGRDLQGAARLPAQPAAVPDAAGLARRHSARQRHLAQPAGRQERGELRPAGSHAARAEHSGAGRDQRQLRHQPG